MRLEKAGVAGTLESGDALVEIAPGGKGIGIELDSVVEREFGKQIRAAALETCREYGLEDALLTIHDKGALDCTIRARVAAAIIRASGEEADHGF